MKRIIALILSLMLLLSLNACGKESVEIILKHDKITLTEAGETFRLRVSTDPEDMEDELEFESMDEDIATVDKNGKITAVAPGKTVIMITCGGETAKCKVICDFEDADTAGESADPATCDICGGDGICDYCGGFPICPTCHGLKQCLTCAGIGKIDCPDCDGYSTSCYNCDGRKYFVCTDCDGTGTCPTCNDEGVICDRCDLGNCLDCYEG